MARSAGILLLAAPFGLALQPSASAEQLVKFDAAVPRTQPAAVTPVQGYLTEPPGAGPFPAVVLLHSCLGLPADRRSIGETFASWGYVALFVDDFATRGLRETCAVDFPEGVSDAFGALAFVSALPHVDPARIAAIGWSQGADTALQVASSPSGAASAKFKVAAAIYPPCENQANATLRVPTLILVGQSDAVTPAADCERLARRQPGAKLVVYPGADHEFDNPEFAGGKRVMGMWLKYDGEAAKRSRAALRDFLAAQLGR